MTTKFLLSLGLIRCLVGRILASMCACAHYAASAMGECTTMICPRCLDLGTPLSRPLLHLGGRVLFPWPPCLLNALSLSSSHAPDVCCISLRMQALLAIYVNSQCCVWSGVTVLRFTHSLISFLSVLCFAALDAVEFSGCVGRGLASDGYIFVH